MTFPGTGRFHARVPERFRCANSPAILIICKKDAVESMIAEKAIERRRMFILDFPGCTAILGMENDLPTMIGIITPFPHHPAMVLIGKKDILKSVVGINVRLVEKAAAIVTGWFRIHPFAGVPCSDGFDYIIVISNGNHLVPNYCNSE
jgi:hypothetical protein